MENKMYDNYKILALEYNFSNSDIKKLWQIIKPICEHEEFQKRCEAPFFHHDLKMLGDHILCDAILTYKLVHKLKKGKYDKIRLELAILIAMFHDLYECPWQNTFIKKDLVNKHGFSHPIEAVVNAITWFPSYFKNKEKAIIIIDGIIHHMFPLPVRSIDDKFLDLNNQDKYEALDEKYKEMIKVSTDIGKIGHLSLRRSFFIEGRIMSKADKIVALRKDMHSLHGYLALLSGKNKNVKQIKK